MTKMKLKDAHTSDTTTTLAVAPETKLPEQPKTIRMECSLEGVNGPTTADVHPDEVENWKKAGWYVKG